jgi:hypothetical protein
MTPPHILQEIRDACASVNAALAARGLIYDTGERRDGEIVWCATPGKEAEIEAFLAEGRKAKTGR